MVTNSSNPLTASSGSYSGTPDHSHPRVIGWFGTSALAMGGSNQSLFLITALFIGQGDIPGQGSAAVVLLIVGILLSFAAAPGWTELVLMSPNRVGGISAACTEAFKPYSPILSALTGVCYWWGWIPTCGVTALLSGVAIQGWVLPGLSVPVIATSIVILFSLVNLAGVRWVAALAMPIACASALLAFISMLAPILSGSVNWQQAVDFHLTVPFEGVFGTITSLMAGLYLIGFGAPAFEAATCHVGETVDPVKNVPKAMLVSSIMAAVFFVALPLVWLGTLGEEALGRDLAEVLGPTFAPLLGSFAKSAAIGFMMFNMFHGTLQPLAGAARTMSQLSEDGLAPKFLALRSKTDAPWAATASTAAFAIVFLWIGDPIWLIAAANFTYLIGICMPSIAVWLLRRDAPDAERLWRAPDWTITAGLVAACVWGMSALLGFEQFGLPTVVIGLAMAYSGAFLFAWRKLEDRIESGAKGLPASLHVKLTGAMLLVLALDAAGYMLAVGAIPQENKAFVVALEDIFVAVAILTISVGIVLPGMIAHSADQVSAAAKRLATGTVKDLATAMQALGAGRLNEAHAVIDIVPVTIKSNDELGVMADSFNEMQEGIREAAVGLDHARIGLSSARTELIRSNDTLAEALAEQERLTKELFKSKEDAVWRSLHDPLTGLPNRAFFINRLETAIARCRDFPDKNFSILFIDLDRFKFVNDSMGHVAGDLLLITVGKRLEQLMMKEGFISSGSYQQDDGNVFARLGGDEFLIFIRDDKIGTNGRQLAAFVQQSMADPVELQGEQFVLTASVGIAINGASYDNPTSLLRDADLAMYHAKKLGKARAEIYDEAMHGAVTSRLLMENRLRAALSNQEFVLHYQPIMSLKNERLVGFEALVRWQPPSGPLIYPGDFIDILEETGMIVPLGLFVMEKACIQCREWSESMGFGSELTMSINLSSRQFAQADLVTQIERILSDTRVNPKQIKIELTESSTVENPERAIEIFTNLKQLGVQISLDDFGTGYSSLGYLHRFPIDILKIDRSFVSRMMENPENLQLVATILALARGMRMEVVAEGIESKEQSEKLRQMGCDYGQGYFYSRPCPSSDAAAFMMAEKVRDARKIKLDVTMLDTKPTIVKRSKKNSKADEE